MKLFANAGIKELQDSLALRAEVRRQFLDDLHKQYFVQFFVDMDEVFTVNPVNREIVVIITKGILASSIEGTSRINVGDRVAVGDFFTVKRPEFVLLCSVIRFEKNKAVGYIQATLKLMGSIYNERSE
jgi:hypothetical protein